MADWLETANGNRISKAANIYGSQFISINENTTINEKVVLKGDVKLLQPKSDNAVIKLGKFCYFSTGCQIIPPVLKKDVTGSLHGPMRIGSYTLIGKNSVVKLALIGNRVLVENNCILDELSIIYDCCIIRENTVIPPKMVIPPFSEVSGKPGENFTIKELTNGYKKVIEHEANKRHVLG